MPGFIFGDAHHPDRWEYLAEFYAKLRRFKRIEKDEFRMEHPIFLRKRMPFGSAKAYRRADRYFKNKFLQHLLEKYEDPPLTTSVVKISDLTR